MKEFLLTIIGESGAEYGIAIECDTWEQAQEAADDMGARLDGQLVETVEADLNLH